jgi:hypothetical protein
MRKPKKSAMLLVVVITAFVAAQNKEAAKPRPAPEMQRLARMLVGTWKVEKTGHPEAVRRRVGKKPLTVLLGSGRAVFLP